MRSLRAALPLTVAVVLGVAPVVAAAPADPAEGVRPTAQELRDSVADLDIRDAVHELALEVSEIDVPSSVSGVERADDAPGVITLDTDVLFAFGSAELSGPAKSAIAKVAADLTSAAGQVAVVGHTDSIGSEAANQKLSEARADAVAAALRQALGASGPRVVASGKGESDPVAPNTKGGEDDPQGRALNRRVEIRTG